MEHEALERKVAEFERFCGQLAWEDTVLKKAVRQVGSRSVTHALKRAGWIVNHKRVLRGMRASGGKSRYCAG